MIFSAMEVQSYAIECNLNTCRYRVEQPYREEIHLDATEKNTFGIWIKRKKCNSILLYLDQHNKTAEAHSAQNW